MTEVASKVAEFKLKSVSGPTQVDLTLRPPGPLMVGRRSTHDLALVGDDHVSRDHAKIELRRLTHSGKTSSEASDWAINDMGSRHGTWVNGARLTPGRQCPLRVNDEIVIAPWTFRVVGPGGGTGMASSIRIKTIEDTDSMAGSISRVAPGAERTLAQKRLTLLLDCAGAIHGAHDENSLAEAVLDAAVLGAGFANAALLRALEEDGTIEVVAHRGEIMDGARGARLSRSLIREASKGNAVRLPAAMHHRDEAHSIMQLDIDDALCAPIMIGASVAGFLYMDNRNVGGSTRAAEDATEFAVGLARLAAMAMASLKRIDLERRHALLEAEQAAGAEAQRWILPPRIGSFTPFTYIGESKPGRNLGGDFFDVAPLGEGKVAVALGDVSGKGVAASVLMTATQGHLHALLREQHDPARAVSTLNRFVHPRRPEGRFVTLWLGVFDAENETLSYVDAGHGYAFLMRSNGEVERLDAEGGTPIGLAPDVEYTGAVTPFRAGDRALVVSDGLIEQPMRTTGQRRGAAFGAEGVLACFSSAEQPDIVGALFDAIRRYAQSERLEDDATAVQVQW